LAAMVSFVSVLLCGLVVCAQAGTWEARLRADMQPEVVSKLLSEVSQKWVSGALAAMRKEVAPQEGLKAMKKSCDTVASSIVKGSEGDRAKAKEYLRDVCASATAGADSDMCGEFSTGLLAKLSNDAYTNREVLNVDNFCAEFYAGAVQKAAAQQEKVLAAKDAKAAEEAKKAKDAKIAEEKMAADAKVAQETHTLAQKLVQETKKAEALVNSTNALESKESDAEKDVERARHEVQLASQKEAEAEADAAERVAEASKAKAEAARKAAEEKKKDEQEKVEKKLEETKAEEKLAEKKAEEKQIEDKQIEEKKAEEKKAEEKKAEEKKPEEKKVETKKEEKKQGLLAKRVQLGQKARLDINQKAYIEGQPVLGDGAGQGNLNKCMELADAFVKNPMAPDVKVCGTGIKLTVFLLGRCGEGSVNSANLAHTWDIGACDSGLAPSVCKEKSPSQDKRMGVSQSYKVTQC